MGVNYGMALALAHPEQAAEATEMGVPALAYISNPEAYAPGSLWYGAKFGWAPEKWASEKLSAITQVYQGIADAQQALASGRGYIDPRVLAQLQALAGHQLSQALAELSRQESMYQLEQQVKWNEMQEQKGWNVFATILSAVSVIAGAATGNPQAVITGIGGLAGEE